MAKVEEKSIERAGLIPEVVAPEKPKCPRCKSGAVYELDPVDGKYAGHKCCSCFHGWSERE